MNKQYIEQEVDKIINDKSFQFPQNLAMASAWVIGNMKGNTIKILDVRQKSSLTDFFVLASANNLTQANAMAELVSVQLKRCGFIPRSIEGRESSDWILIDMGDIIINIFEQNARSFYDFDNLWPEAGSIEIPQHYYSSADLTEMTKKSDEDKAEDYF